MSWVPNRQATQEIFRRIEHLLPKNVYEESNGGENSGDDVPDLVDIDSSYEL
jgi:hypothetical protein